MGSMVVGVCRECGVVFHREACQVSLSTSYASPPSMAVKPDSVFNISDYIVLRGHYCDAHMPPMPESVLRSIAEENRIRQSEIDGYKESRTKSPVPFHKPNAVVNEHAPYVSTMETRRVDPDGDSDVWTSAVGQGVSGPEDLPYIGDPVFCNRRNDQREVVGGPGVVRREVLSGDARQRRVLPVGSGNETDVRSCEGGGPELCVGRIPEEHRAACVDARTGRECDVHRGASRSSGKCTRRPGLKSESLLSVRRGFPDRKPSYDAGGQQPMHGVRRKSDS